MPLWGNKKEPVKVDATTKVETTEGAPIGTYVYVRGGGGDNAHFGNTSGSRANTDLNMYKAQTPFPTMPNMKVGIIPVDANNIATPNNTPAPGPVTTQTLSVPTMTDPGQGYRAPVTADAVFANGYTAVGFFTGNVQVGALKGLYQTTPSPLGTIYTSTPTVNNVTGTYRMNIKPCNGLGFSNVTNQILVANANLWLEVNDKLFYDVPPGGTPIVPINGDLPCYVQSVNSTGFTVSATLGGAVTDITDTRNNTATTEIHTFFGYGGTVGPVVTTNVITASVGGSADAAPVAHTGWVLRKEGTGGRAGRVQYEVLVAMGSLPNT